METQGKGSVLATTALRLHAQADAQSRAAELSEGLQVAVGEIVILLTPPLDPYRTAY